MEVESKTSDEILEELFSALNVPISPKVEGAQSTEEDQEKGKENNQEKDNSVDSEGTEDKDADSKSSDTDEEPKEQAEKATKNHKHKSSKKKKEKKKKKKKHKRKDDDGRHKSKKKHKKSSAVDSGEEDNNTSPVIVHEVMVKAEDIAGKLATVIMEQAEKSVGSNNQEVEVISICSPKPKSPKSNKELGKSVSQNSIGKNDAPFNAGVKELKKLPEKPKSPRRSHSSSKSVHSRSRSSSRTRHQQSRSRSRHDRRSRSRSRSKTDSRRSRSKTTTSYKSKARSPFDSDRLKRKRKYSRSRSRSLSPKLSKKRRYSRSRSKSPLSRSGRRRSSRSYSRSLSPKFSRRKRHLRSRSPSPVKRTSKYRSRSRSRSSRRASQYRDISNSFCKSSESAYSKDIIVLSINGTTNASSKGLESSSTKEDPSKDSKNVILDLNSIPTPDVQPPICPSALPISLESIPLPVPPVSSELPDPSSIPLPQPVVLIKEEPNGKEEPSETKINQIDLGAIPVPGSGADVPTKEQEPAKPADAGAEKSKAKMIIIKSLKDSLIYMQAQEEAERRAKVKQEDEPEDTDDEKGDENDEKGDTCKEQKEEQDEGQPVSEEAEEKAKTDEESKEEVEEVIITEAETATAETTAETTTTTTAETATATATTTTTTATAKETATATEKTAAAATAKGKGKGKVNKKPKKGEQSEMEDGEILSENDDATKTPKTPKTPTTTPKTKSHKKKSKKDKDKSKEKKKSKKEKSKDKKKQSKERSKSKERTVRSRSKSKERSKHRKSSSSWHRDHDSDRRHRRYSRSRSRSRDRHSRFRHRSYSRSRSRSRSRSGRKRDCVSDLRDKVTRKRLLDIARRNAVYLMQNGCLPPSVEQEQLVKIKTGGKSVEELTDFCKQLVATGNYSDADLSDPSLSSDDDNDNPDKPFSCTRHPFSVRDSKPILMNIRNAPMLPTKTNAERLADHAKLREQFPVSSGSQHRTKGEVNTSEDNKLVLLSADSGWVPVSPKEKKQKEEDSVFSKEKAPSVDISQIVSSRLSAMRKLQDNPHDMEALKTLHNVQKDMQTWALSKQEPGQFTGSTGVKILSQEELCAGQQAWVRKEQFKEAAPVRPQFGLKMLQKMGWTPGEGLGKNKEGAIEPLLLDVKMDKKGFHAQEELTPKKQPIPMAKDLSGEFKELLELTDPLYKGKHPVSALVELCSKHKWQPPEFEMVFDYGPDHKKNFLMKVKVNNQEYKPAVAGPTKKLAKANAAAACLQSLGLFPRDPENPLAEANQG